MKSDRELLTAYARGGSQTAFTELVDRHISLVYRSALRRLCGNEVMARDVAQSVFTTLAFKPPHLSRSDSLTGWLFTTTRYAASHLVRAERRRQERETKAEAMNTRFDDRSRPEPSTLPSDVIDEVLHWLEPKDRDVILLRFFQNRSYSAIAAETGATEDGARMRVNRALENLRARFARQGIVSSVSAIAAALSAEAVGVPSGLAVGISASALTQAGALAAAAPKLTLLALMNTKLVLIGSIAVSLLAVSSALQQKARSILGEAKLQASVSDAAHLRADLQQTRGSLANAERQTTALQVQLSQLTAAQQRRTDVGLKGQPLKPAERQRRLMLAAKMAELKPLLAAGAPISGTAVVLVNGQPTDKPIAFVIGRETDVESDEGTYSITPQLQSDGSIKYLTRLCQTLNGQSTPVTAAVVVAAPWTTFQMNHSGPHGIKAFAFVPDRLEPQ